MDMEKVKLSYSGPGSSPTRRDMMQITTIPTLPVWIG